MHAGNGPVHSNPLMLAGHFHSFDGSHCNLSVTESPLLTSHRDTSWKRPPLIANIALGADDPKESGLMTLRGIAAANERAVCYLSSSNIPVAISRHACP